MGLKRVSWVRRCQRQCRALRPLGHQGYRLRNYKKDPPLCSGYSPPLNLGFMLRLTMNDFITLLKLEVHFLKVNRVITLAPQKLTPTDQMSGGNFLHGGNTKNK